MATTETTLHDEIRSYLEGLTVDSLGEVDAEVTFGVSDRQGGYGQIQTWSHAVPCS